MRTYSVTFSENVPMDVSRQIWNKETNNWEDTIETVWKNYYTFYDLSSAKKFIKKHIDKYVSSSITKVWANGDWENLGEIKLSGSNKHFIANTKMKGVSYA